MSSLIDRILAGGADLLAEEDTPVYFPGDDLFAVMRPSGLPIGNLTSQFFANVYLHPLDLFIPNDNRNNNNGFRIVVAHHSQPPADASAGASLRQRRLCE